MALSQFHPKLAVAPDPSVTGRERLVIAVGGPLDIAEPDDYEHPIVVQFQVVQVPRGEHSETDVKRVRGTGQEVDGQKQWSGSVELGALRTGPADETNLETRGVAIAVLERTKQFAFDTITWCDEVELVDEPPASGP